MFEIKYKIPKNQHLYTRYSKQNSDIITHILCYQQFTEPNKRWILYSVDNDNKLTKVAQGDNPLVLEQKVGLWKHST